MKRFPLTLQQTEAIEPYYIFTFEKPEDLMFESGQYGVFLHVDKEIEGRRMRAFTFASNPKDNILQIGTIIHENPSDFKQKMKDLQPGDTMTVDGPMGRFTWDQKNPAVFITTSIGITPIASIFSQQLHGKATLLYHEPDQKYLFDEYFDQENVNVFYSTSMSQLLDQIKNSVKIETMYYVSGPMSFVGKITDTLTSLNISKDNIKTERFTGY